MYSILLVDKKSLFRDVFATALAKRLPNVQVVVAENCAQALGVIRESPSTNMVIANIRLPDLSGLWLTSEIKNKYSDIACVLLSLFDSHEYIEMATESKADYFICPAVANMEDLSRFIESRLPATV